MLRALRVLRFFAALRMTDGGARSFDKLRMSGRTALRAALDSRIRGNDEGGGNDECVLHLEFAPAAVTGAFDEEESCAGDDHEDGAHREGTGEVDRARASQVVEDGDGHGGVFGAIE